MTDTGGAIDVVIERLGARGDGIAETEAGALYVPLALPGERVRVKPGDKRGDGHAAALLEILEPSPARVAPPCPHFGACGGCSVQHLAEDAYQNWKRDIVVAALARIGIASELVAPLIATPAGDRRRAELAAIRLRGRSATTLLGFHAAASHRVVDADGCVVLRPALQALIAPLRTVLAEILEPAGRCDVLLTETLVGVDLLITAKAPPRRQQSQALAAFAEAADLARASWVSPRAGIEPVAQRRAPSVAVGGVQVALPPGAFLQASAAAEQILARLVSDALGQLPERARVADLYAGLGTFAFPLAAAAARVHAVDSSGEALAALSAAAGAAGLGGRITTEARDLAERPLMAVELATHDAVVFDPPRAGAAALARQLAESKVPTVVAVSCNPATFARDAATLIDGGYRLVGVTPVDQFVYTGHVELVAEFVRD